MMVYATSVFRPLGSAEGGGTTTPLVDMHDVFAEKGGGRRRSWHGGEAHACALVWRGSEKRMMKGEIEGVS